MTNHDPLFRDQGAEAWAAFPRIIASLATARRPEHRRAITDLVYDLVVVDDRNRPVGIIDSQDLPKFKIM